MESGNRPSNARLFWPVLLVIVAIDVLTKRAAVEALADQQRVPHEVLSHWLRMTLVYNPGAAFGLHVGEYSRWVFTALTVGALVILGRLYLSTKHGDSSRVAALSLVCGGAMGNLLDRIASKEGVIDFIDIGVREARWPTFNVADMAVSVGAFLLAVVLWSEDRAAESEVGVAGTLVPAELPRQSGEVS
ncbi:MAG: signal peptidase II [Gemmatimonadota bacterium]